MQSLRSWRRGRATDGRLATPLATALLALAAGLTPHLPHLPIWIVALGVGCGAQRWFAERRRWHLVPVWLRRVLAVGAFLAVLVVYRSLNGIEPGTALLVVMAALKLLETWRRRDLFVILFISLFLVLAALLREQALWTLPYVIVALAVIGAAWLNVARRGAPLSPARSLGYTARLLAHAAPLLLLFWILFPRIQGTFWSVQTPGSSGVTGITDTISPGDISQLSQSDAVAFRVRFDGERPPRSSLYWRGPVLQNFNGRSWSGGEAGTDPTAARSIAAEGAPVDYTVSLEPTGQRWLFALDMPLDWQRGIARMTSSQQLKTFGPIAERLSYRATSAVRYRLTGPVRERVFAVNTALPDARNPEAKAFAARLFAESGDDAARYVDAVLRHFREESFAYTLRPPALGADSVDEFLFDTRRGFCEHFASSFAFLMRAAGVPARVVVGYLGGEENRFGDYWMVRQSDAHAWTEVWLGERGWVRIDPTAEVSALRLEQGLDAALSEFGESRGWDLFNARLMINIELIWDTVNARWDEWVLGYGPETQRRFLEWLGMDDPDWRRMTAWLGGIAALILALTTLGLARRYRRASSDPAHRVYRRTLNAIGADVRSAESPETVYRRVAGTRPAIAGDLRRFTDSYLALRYAGRGTIDSFSAEARQLRRAAEQAPGTTTARR